MKNYTVFIICIWVFLGCSKSNQKTAAPTNSNTNTTPPAPANVTTACGNWIMDSTAVFAVNSPNIGDTSWHNNTVFYSNPSTYYLTLSSGTYVFTPGTETITGYDAKGLSPGSSGLSGHFVWKITGDTTYFPTTNKPINQGGTVYYGIEILTSHTLVLSTRAYCAQQGVNMSGFVKYYYHK